MRMEDTVNTGLIRGIICILDDLRGRIMTARSPLTLKRKSNLIGFLVEQVPYYVLNKIAPSKTENFRLRAIIHSSPKTNSPEELVFA